MRMPFTDIEEAFRELARLLNRESKLGNDHTHSPIGTLVLHGDWVGEITTANGGCRRLIAGTFLTNYDFWQAIDFFVAGVELGKTIAAQ
jgi:hypothetical protein